MTASSETGIEIRLATPVTRRRRAGSGLAFLLVVAGAAGGLYIALHSAGGGGSPSGTNLGHHYQSSLGWSIRYPRGLHVERSGADGFGYGAHETTFSSFAASHGVRARISPRMQSIRLMPPRARSGRFPAEGIALRVLYQWSHVPVRPGFRPAGTRLPLSLSQFHDAPRSWYGDPRPLWHSLTANGQSYQILVWIGKRASTKQRLLVESMLASLSVHRVSQQH